MQSKKQTKKRKKITKQYLENAGAFYLNRFSSSQSNFHRVMLRKIEKSLIDHPDQNKSECIKMLDGVIDKFVSLGYLDDHQYVRQNIQSLRRQGKSRRAIISKLRQKGVDSEIIETEMNELESLDGNTDREENNIELLSALRHCRKKRMGPFADENMNCNDKQSVDNKLKKDLARLARAGFDFKTSRAVIEMSKNEAERFLNYL